MRVLIIEDEGKVAAAVREGLEQEGHVAAVETTGDGGLRRARAEPFDVIVLDLGLPGLSGLDVLEALRRRTARIPVLIMTARDSVADRVAGLDAGADDYVIKPFAFAELAARVRALERRGAAPLARLTESDLSVDVISRRVERAGMALDLTMQEFKLLQYLLQHAGEVVSRETLARDVWTEPARNPSLDNVIDVHIARVRKKVHVGGLPDLIHTVRGVGFVLRAGAE
jgi:DNA-binding response OmpR family regulator